MNKIFIFLAYLFLNTALLSLGTQIGWGHNPGIIGPLLIVFSINLMLAVFSSAKN